MPFQEPKTKRWRNRCRPFAILGSCLLLSFFFRGYGAVAALCVVGLFLMLHSMWPHSPEIQSLRDSIHLSLEDIENLLHASPPSRTREEASTFLTKARARLDSRLSRQQLETLLAMADAHAASLEPTPPWSAEFKSQSTAQTPAPRHN